MPERPDSFSPMRRATGVAALMLALTAAIAAYVVAQADVAPRELARYVTRRAEGHGPIVTRPSHFVAASLRTVDEGSRVPVALPSWIGAQDTRPSPLPGSIRLVRDLDALASALAGARPGDIIQLLPGQYTITGRSLTLASPGRADAPIRLSAARLGDVRIGINALEGFRVTGPHWHIENLEMHGTCERHDDCEHAIHVVGDARHVVVRNNRIVDFNAHIKINGEGGRFPDEGRITDNSFTNTSVRRTSRSVTPIDLVAASGWTMEGNVIADFIKGEGNRVSYGAFAKGGGAGNRFERNLVICENVLRQAGSQTVGLSLGGGGTGEDFCRDGRCVVEQQAGVLRNNLITRCSDRGVYLNGAADSRLIHNTILDTAGVTVRFPHSSARFAGNLIDAPVSVRDGALVHEGDDESAGRLGAYMGLHAVRRLFHDPGALELDWAASPPRRAAAAEDRPPVDLCGIARPAKPAYGAVEDWRACGQK